MAAQREKQDPQPTQKVDSYHAQPAKAVLAVLETTESGLDTQEVENRLSRYGRNELPPPQGKHPVLRFLSQFNNALIYFLLAAAVGAAALDHLLDASVILAVVVINAVVGFV